MAKKQLKIKIMPNGEIQMQTLGIKGKKCLDYAEMLQVLTDAKVVRQDYTDEYYEQEEDVIYDENVYNNEQNP